ncbi:hypothetical protein IEQ34_020025 [Dendrobium chrysotoxum]|uniref:Uncharacterized protein n=1 Tax=Dendrobium chrysotoxum TaxID=161865 RepID=A0AAV7G8K2_DENCH|nr:hypothetical protein IEQ34_020025 [Dendrobium chrysotoxum]
MNDGVFNSSSKNPPEGKKEEVSFFLKKRKFDDRMILPKDNDICRETVHPVSTNDPNGRLGVPLVQKKALKILIIEKSILQADTEAHIEDISSKAIEKFKKSLAYHQEIQDNIREAYQMLFKAEVKGVESQCYEEVFAHGFLKGVLLVQWKTGVSIDKLTHIQASENSSLASGDDHIESELRNEISYSKGDGGLKDCSRQAMVIGMIVIGGRRWLEGP